MRVPVLVQGPVASYRLKLADGSLVVSDKLRLLPLLMALKVGLKGIAHEHAPVDRLLHHKPNSLRFHAAVEIGRLYWITVLETRLQICLAVLFSEVGVGNVHHRAGLACPLSRSKSQVFQKSGRAIPRLSRGETHVFG